jgi:hypothetical protein
MSGRPAVKSAFQNLRPTILREPARSAVSVEAEQRLLTVQATREPEPAPPKPTQTRASVEDSTPPPATPTPASAPLLLKKKRERLLLVSFRMPQTLKEKLENVAKAHEINQTDIINEAIELNLQRYM